MPAEDARCGPRPPPPPPLLLPPPLPTRRVACPRAAADDNISCSVGDGDADIDGDGDIEGVVERMESPLLLALLLVG
jgi:hypothetical protein